jgi:hypothetical protein
MSQSSYVSSNDPRLHFGLGSTATVDIEVRWPLGLTAVHRNVAADQLITLYEGQSEINAEKIIPVTRTPKSAHNRI